MTMESARLVLVLLWTVLVRFIVWPMAHLLALVSDRIRDQLKNRKHSRELAVELATLRRSYDDCVIFFCSSAGEYEQAKPIIERISSNPTVLCHVIFFSASGPEFIKARKEQVSWSLAPKDDVFEWGTIFAALRPTVTYVIRHELWPAFLWAASQWSKVIVINAVVPSLLGRQAEWKETLNLMIKSWLLRFVDVVCVVSTSDKEFFESRLGLGNEKVFVTGDTKYDRVIERAAGGRHRTEKVRDLFRNEWQPVGTDKIIVCGSAHVPDVELLLEAFSQPKLNCFRVIVVPHDVSSGNVAVIFDKIAKKGHTVELLSEIKAAGFKFPSPSPRFVVVDELGRLFDLYSVADLAWVGGAVHDKVHNVLEPAAWGVPVTSGPKVENSQEASAMRKEGLLLSASAPDEVCAQWYKLLGNIQDYGKRTEKFAADMAGASGRVIAMTLPIQLRNSLR